MFLIPHHLETMPIGSTLHCATNHIEIMPIGLNVHVINAYRDRAYKECICIRQTVGLINTIIFYKFNNRF